MFSSTVPQNNYQAAEWLRGRHPWLNHLVTRVTGPADPDRPTLSRRGGELWLDELVDAFNALDEIDQAWADYRDRHREPRDDAAWEAWNAAGPQLDNPAAEALAPMSGGEVRLLRLVATLAVHDRMTAGWRVDDVSFDERGAAVLADWLDIVREQLR